MPSECATQNITQIIELVCQHPTRRPKRCRLKRRLSITRKEAAPLHSFQTHINRPPVFQTTYIGDARPFRYIRLHGRKRHIHFIFRINRPRRAFAFPCAESLRGSSAVSPDGLFPKIFDKILILFSLNVLVCARLTAFSAQQNGGKPARKILSQPFSDDLHYP